MNNNFMITFYSQIYFWDWDNPHYSTLGLPLPVMSPKEHNEYSGEIHLMGAPFSCRQLFCPYYNYSVWHVIEALVVTPLIHRYSQKLRSLWFLIIRQWV